MRFTCPKCKSDQITEINKNGKHYYYCSSCLSTSQRALNTSRPVLAIRCGDEIKHAGAGALIWHKDKFLLLKRRMYPYSWATPGGHMEEGETPEMCLEREILEETGVIISNPTLIYKGEIKGDRCRYGINLHDWYLYSAKMPTNSRIFLNAESEKFGWFSPKEALLLDLTVPVRYLIENVVVNGDKKTKIDLDSEKNIGPTGTTISHLIDKKSDLIFHLSQALFKIDHLDSILNSAVTETLFAFNAETASIALVDHLNNELEIKAIKKFDDNNIPVSHGKFSFGEGAAGLCALKRSVITVENTSKSPALAGEKKRVGSIVCVPIVSNDSLLGVLSVNFSYARKFPEYEIQFLQVLAGMIGSAIENNMLVKSQETKIKNLSKLFGVTPKIFKIKPNIRKIADVAPELLECETVQILFYSPETNELSPYITTGKIHEANDHLRISLDDQSISRYVFLEKKAYCTNDVPNDELAIKLKNKDLYTKSMLSVPIIIDNNCYGIINMINKINHNFGNDDIKIAQIVATRIASLVENNHLVVNTQQEKELSNNIIQNITDGVMVLDSNGRILVWNDSLEKLTDIPAKTTVGKEYQNILEGEMGLSDIPAKITEALSHSQKKNLYIEEEVVNQTGDRTWVGAFLSYIFNGSKNLENIIVVFRNIAKDRDLIKAKNDFITTTTHELRTPLTSIKGYLSMLLHGDAGQLTQKQAQYFSKAYMSTERLVQLVEDLLVALKIEENKVSLSVQTFDINKIILESIDNINVKAILKNITINYTSKPNQYLGLVDTTKTKHILENLIDNAIKYTKKNGKIDISLDRKDSYLSIKIKDTGVGIPKKDLNTIFDRFTRIQNSLSIEAGGTGLGLYIVKNFVERQKGKISAESELGKGSTFFVELPAAII